MKQEIFQGQNYSFYKKLIDDIKIIVNDIIRKELMIIKKECLLLIIGYIPLNNLFNCPCFSVRLKLNSNFFGYQISSLKVL